jgi:hypothetical protein
VSGPTLHRVPLAQLLTEHEPRFLLEMTEDARVSIVTPLGGSVEELPVYEQATATLRFTSSQLVRESDGSFTAASDAMVLVL